MAINVKDKLVTVESLDIAYSTEQGARQEADQALSTRIDNIVAPDGDPSLTEVSDARVSGSTTHNTLKARLDADQAAVGTEIAELKAELDALASGLSDEAKSALLNCFSNVAWIDTDGQNYYDTLHDALFPPTELNRISAVYTQSGPVYRIDSLDSLKTDLIVTAHMTDNTTKTITAYTLSGVLSVGTSTITVSYGGKTTTFTVVVTEYDGVPTDYTWLYRVSNDGLLSENSNILNFSKNNQNIVEEIVDDKLHIVIPKNKSENSIRYSLSPATNNHAKILAKIKFNSIPFSPAGSSARIQVSKGSSGGARIMERQTENGSNIYKFSIRDGDVNLDVADLLLETWYVVGVELNGNTQILSIDGETIYTAYALNGFATENAINIQTPPNDNATPLDVEIEWVAYKNFDVAG